VSEKKKYFRFLPLLAGIFGLILSFIASIPMGSSLNISFHIVEMENVYFYLWGLVENGAVWFDFSLITLDNLVPLIFWIFCLCSAIFGIIGTFYTEKPSIVKKLLIIAGFSMFVELVYYIIILIIYRGNLTLGIGFYALISMIVIYFVSSLSITEYQK
jgi:hypothetical protein